ncbi:Fc.00g078990.m01.CDS01 [Cosmosporella sp. VM-42]
MTAPPLTSTQGWVALDKAAIGKLVWQELPLRPPEESDVDIEVTHCAICGTDTHTIQDSWGSTIYPCCIGHEIIGTVIRVGTNVTGFKPGDRVGVGPQGFACLEDDCVACGRGFPQRCPKFVQTHNGRWIDGKSALHGGLAKVHRAHVSIVMKIPDQIPSKYAAPMLCAGITSWAPLKRHGAGPGKSVGVLGVGGIGHFALIWAKALRCDKVVAISRTSSKKEDALNELGADEFIAMAEDEDWATKNAGSLDIILSTSDSADMPMRDILGLLKLGGTFVAVGASVDSLPDINTYTLIAGMLKIEGSFWGTYMEVQDMFEFAAANKVRPKIQEYAMNDANAALVDQCKGKAKYKYVLSH